MWVSIRLTLLIFFGLTHYFCKESIDSGRVQS